jgi:hypothetical protein
MDGYTWKSVEACTVGLKQSGIIANQQLQKHLAKYSYAVPTPCTPGLWRHHTCNIAFLLVVDDFGVKYVGKEHTQHLLSGLQDLYAVSTDWDGALYCGVTIKWDYKNGHIGISMPGYVQAALHKFQHPHPSASEDSPHIWNEPTYGAKVQYANPLDTSAKLPPDKITCIQQIISNFLYYGIEVDPTMLVTLDSLAASQSEATQTTLDAIAQPLFELCSLSSTLSFASTPVTWSSTTTATAPTSVSKARSRAGGHFYLSQHPEDRTKPPIKQPRNNGPTHSTCQILRNVMASAAEAEVGALSSSTDRTPSPFTTLSSNSDIPNRPRPCKPTTLLPPDSPTTPSNKSAPKPWTCTSIGYKIGSSKASSSSTGNPALKTPPTTTPSIIHRITIDSCGQTF